MIIKKLKLYIQIQIKDQFNMKKYISLYNSKGIDQIIPIQIPTLLSFEIYRYDMEAK